MKCTVENHILNITVGESQLKPPSPREVARRSRDGGSPLDGSLASPPSIVKGPHTRPPTRETCTMPHLSVILHFNAQNFAEALYFYRRLCYNNMNNY